MTFVPAILYMCLLASPMQCERHDVRVEPAACHAKTYLADVPIGGEWRRVRVGIRCAGK